MRLTFFNSLKKSTQQPAALRLIQLLGAQLDNGADAGDAEAQGAVLNSISACEKCVFVFVRRSFAVTGSGVCSAFSEISCSQSLHAPHRTNKTKQHRSYTGKLREDLDTFSREVFVLASDRERVQSILQDLNKTARDFAGIEGRAVEQLSTLLVGRSR